MKKVKQLTLFLDNKPGVLSRVCASLARRKVNIAGISVLESHDHSVVRIITDNPKVAIHTLGAGGLLVLEDDVLVVDLPNRVGALGAVARRLGAAKVNIEYSYCTAEKHQDTAQMVLSVNDVRKALRVLKPLMKRKKK